MWGEERRKHELIWSWMEPVVFYGALALLATFVLWLIGLVRS